MHVIVVHLQIASQRTLMFTMVTYTEVLLAIVSYDIEPKNQKENQLVGMFTYSFHFSPLFTLDDFNCQTGDIEFSAKEQAGIPTSWQMGQMSPQTKLCTHLYF